MNADVVFTDNQGSNTTVSKTAADTQSFGNIPANTVQIVIQGGSGGDVGSNVNVVYIDDSTLLYDPGTSDTAESGSGSFDVSVNGWDPSGDNGRGQGNKDNLTVTAFQQYYLEEPNSTTVKSDTITQVVADVSNETTAITVNSSAALAQFVEDKPVELVNELGQVVNFAPETTTITNVNNVTIIPPEDSGDSSIVDITNWLTSEGITAITGFTLYNKPGTQYTLQLNFF